MKIKFIRNYRKASTGNMVYVYGVTGTPEQIEAYKKAQGENLVIDEKTGTPLWFSTRYVGESSALIITQNGKVIADTSDFDKAASLCEQYQGTALGTELARVMAEKLLGGSGSASHAAAPAEKSAGINQL